MTESVDQSPLGRHIAELQRRRREIENVNFEFAAPTRVFTVSNQKGGVGKTTTAVNLAAALADIGANVLVVDLDPQGNASTALGVPHTADIASVYDVLVDEFDLAEVVQQSPEHPNLKCAPSTINLAGAEIELVSLVAREQRLKIALEKYLASNPTDVVIVDCPPSLGLLTINAMTAAKEVIIPIQAEYYALEGLSQLLGSIQLIQKHLNPELDVSTILLTMFDSRTKLAQQVADEVRNHFAEQTLETVIPRSVRLSEAPSFGQTITSYDPNSVGAIAYKEAAIEIARRGNVTQKENTDG